MALFRTMPSSDAAAVPPPSDLGKRLLEPLAAPASPGLATAYLCHRAAVHGPGCLFRQLETITRYAERSGLVLPAKGLYVDSGWPDDGAAIGASLTRLLRDAEAGRVPQVIVDRLSRFSKDPLVAARTQAALHAFGVPVLAAHVRSKAAVLRAMGHGSA